MQTKKSSKLLGKKKKPYIRQGSARFVKTFSGQTCLLGSCALQAVATRMLDRIQPINA
jgi:hypothetical protein